MPRRRAVVLCPGRGSYSRHELGSLQGRDSSWVQAFDALRAQRGQPGPTALDAEPRFSPRRHIAGEHASILTAACTLADLEALDPERVEMVGVVGNSMGWYTALGAAGSLSAADCGLLIDTMGAYQTDHVVGGQLVYPLVDDEWRPDPRRIDAVHAALDGIEGLYWSIHLGGQAVLGGTEEAVRAAQASLPEIPGKGLSFPLRLPLHSAFHTPLLQETRERADGELAGLGWRAPQIPLYDGRGQPWRPRLADPRALRDYTLGHQVTEPFDFSGMLRAALGDLAPDLVILPGPGSNLGGAVGQVLVALGWQGVASKSDFLARQERDPFVVSMARPEQRALVVRGAP